MASRHSHTALPRQAIGRKPVVFSQAKRGTAVPPRDRCRARQQDEGCFCLNQTINASGIFPLAFPIFSPWPYSLFPGRHNRHSFSAAIGQDCKAAPARCGPPHLEQQSSQRIEPGRVLGPASRWSGGRTARRCSRTGVSHRLHCCCPARQRNMTAQALGPK